MSTGKCAMDAVYGATASESTAAMSTSPGTAFEGPEKRLHIGVQFIHDEQQQQQQQQQHTSFSSGDHHKYGARLIPRVRWDHILALMEATILDAYNADVFVNDNTVNATVYLLSESSLFVHPQRIAIVTCGQTLPLLSISELQLALKECCGMEITSLCYSRKDYTFPWMQKPPHASLEQEYKLLKRHFPQGHAQVLGPLDGDHYFYYLFSADDFIEETSDPFETVEEQQVNMALYDFDRNMAKMFSSDQMQVTNDRTCALRRATRFEALFCSSSEDHVHQDVLFAPCGYSLNVLYRNSPEQQPNKNYATVHITPEDTCRYASLEIYNATSRRSGSDDSAIVSNKAKRLVDLLKPMRFTLSLRTCVAGARPQVTDSEYEFAGYAITNVSSMVSHSQRLLDRTDTFQRQTSITQINFHKMSS